MSHEHCKVWKAYANVIEIVCPHCRKAFEQFPSLDPEGDGVRARESQRAHAASCPGTSRCARRKPRRYEDA